MRPLNQDLEDELPRSRIVGKLPEDFGTRSSTGGSKEVVILLHFPTMLFDWVGQPRKKVSPSRTGRLQVMVVLECAGELCAEWSPSTVILFYLYGRGMNWLHTS